MIPLLLVVFTRQLDNLVTTLISVVTSFAYQCFKWRVCTFKLAGTTKSIFTITNKNNSHYSQHFIFRYKILKCLLAKFIQLLIFSKSANLCCGEINSANLYSRYFIHVICRSFIIYMGYIVFGVADVIYVLKFLACLFLDKFKIQRDV